MKRNHDVADYNECPKKQCNKNYMDKTRRRIIERIIDHAGRDFNSILMLLYIL